MNIWNQICKLNDIEKKYNIDEKPSSLYEGIMRNLSLLIDTHSSRFSLKRVGKEIAQTCWDLKDGVAQYSIMQHAQIYLHKFVFTPHNILRALDENGGVCNLKTYDVIWSVELKSNDPLKYYGKCDKIILPLKKNTQCIIQTQQICKYCASNEALHNPQWRMH